MSEAAVCFVPGCDILQRGFNKVLRFQSCWVFGVGGHPSGDAKGRHNLMREQVTTVVQLAMQCNRFQEEPVYLDNDPFIFVLSLKAHG